MQLKSAAYPCADPENFSRGGGTALDQGGHLRPIFQYSVKSRRGVCVCVGGGGGGLNTLSPHESYQPCLD